MQVVGPVILTAAGAQTPQVDPVTHSPPSVAVQVQNYSGFALTGNVSGAPFSIPPFTATTIGISGLGQIVWNAGQTLSAGSGQVTFVWIARGDVNPTKDGPLTAIIGTYAALSITGTGPWGVSPTNPSYVTYYFTMSAGASTFTITGGVTSTNYGTFNVPAGGGSVTVSFSVLVADTSIILTRTVGTSVPNTVEAVT